MLVRVTRLVIFLFLFSNQLNAQQFTDSAYTRIRNVFGTTPVSRNTVINGLALGVSPDTWREASKLHINGLSISAAPWDVIFTIYTAAFAIESFSKKHKPRPFENAFNTLGLYDSALARYPVKINGLAIATMTNDETLFNGFNFSVFLNNANTMNGIGISGMFNQHYYSRGLSIAGFRNKATHVKGVQIGLFNSCSSGKLVQLGLVNRIGKRVLPFINMNFGNRNSG